MPSHPLPYQQRWNNLWRQFGVGDPDPGLLPALLSRYREPHRKYHTLQHLDACLALFDGVRDQAEHAEEVELALWFHDAIYQVRDPRNESQSAEWARSALLQFRADPQSARRVHALVMATNHQIEPQTSDEALLLDVDLAILGAPPEQFDAYEKQVREELASIPDDAFRIGRRRILTMFFDRDPIYRTTGFRQRFERQAKLNLGQSLAALGSN